MNIEIACATSGVANAGIDYKDVRFVFRLDLPPSVWDLAQEMGRAGQGHHSTSNDFVYYLFFTLKDVIYLFKQINNPSKQCIDKEYCTQQSRDLIDVMKLLANLFSCHKQLIESALGNPQGDRTPVPPCGKCSVCDNDITMWPALCKPGV